MNVPTMTKTAVTREQYEKVSDFILPQLQKLPYQLTYHNFDHVMSVVRATDYLLQKESVPQEDRWLLLTAALLHDVGFLRIYQNHEDLSCDMAREILPPYGYSNESIDAICCMIMSTKIPQKPLDHYSQILCDADLFYLGTDSFIPIANNLFRELKAVGFIKTEEEWNQKQLNFLHQHEYFTKTAMEELAPKKWENVQALEGASH